MNHPNRLLPRNTRHDRRRGFTLIELLVVISMISLLVALLLPALSLAQDSSRVVTCLNHVKQNLTAMHMYLNDSRGTFRPTPYKSAVVTQTNVLWESTSSGRAVGLGYLTRLGYLQGIDSFYCPTNNYLNTYRDHGAASGTTKFGVTGGTATEVFSDYALGSLLMQYPFGSLLLPTATADDDFKIDDNHPAFPVLADVFMRNDPGLPTMRNLYRPHKDQGISVGYIDGSAGHQLLSRIGNVGPGFHDYGTLSSDPSSFFTWSGWIRIYRMRGGK
jgi:prepilin-type N-terminal cleavage/methylation domain-containing protein